MIIFLSEGKRSTLAIPEDENSGCYKYCKKIFKRVFFRGEVLEKYLAVISLKADIVFTTCAYSIIMITYNFLRRTTKI